MKTEMKYNENLESVINQLAKGAFLTVSDGTNINTMTIGWANIGIIWNKPILMVMVRKSRHTYSIMKNAKDFTVSLPINVDLKKALVYCGSYSGRDVDKIAASKLSLENSGSVGTPIISQCDMHYECKIVHSQEMAPQNLESEIKERFYTSQDYHVLYFGEIIESYTTSKNKWL